MTDANVQTVGGPPALADGEDSPHLGVAAEPHHDAPVPLEVHGVSKHWKRMPAPVLDAVGLNLSRGTATWIGGSNGVGKTTLMRIAAGLILPDSGTVRVCGHDRKRDRRAYQRSLGFLTAGDRGLYARLTGLDHLDYWAGLTLIPKGERRGFIERSIERFNLAELMPKRLDRMSMGQRQRIRLAMTFLHEPDLVLLDEPVNSLDKPSIDLLVGALDETIARGGAALWCSPMVEDLGLTFDYLYELESGRLTRV